MSHRRSAAQRNTRAKAERWSASPMDDRDRPFDDAELERWWLHDVTRRWIGLGDGVVPGPSTVGAAREIAAWFERSLRRWRAFGGEPYRPPRPD